MNGMPITVDCMYASYSAGKNFRSKASSYGILLIEIGKWQDIKFILKENAAFYKY